MTQSREISTYYSDRDDVEHDVTVTVSADGPRDVLIESSRTCPTCPPTRSAVCASA